MNGFQKYNQLSKSQRILNNCVISNWFNMFVIEDFIPNKSLEKEIYNL